MGRPIKAAGPGAEDEVTYFFLISLTEKGAVLTKKQRDKERHDVGIAVSNEKGQCQLYSTRGSASDSVSVVTGITIAGAIRIAEAIEKRGYAKATIISGIEVFVP
jgi:hypothetical protein